jgi:hypothetical protein
MVRAAVFVALFRTLTPGVSMAAQPLTQLYKVHLGVAQQTLTVAMDEAKLQEQK